LKQTISVFLLVIVVFFSNFSVEMTNFDSEKEDSTSNDNDQQQPAQEGSNKLKDEETKTHTIQGKTHHSVDANNPEDTDNEKIE
jgi:hypothetical protein